MSRPNSADTYPGTLLELEIDGKSVYEYALNIRISSGPLFMANISRYNRCLLTVFPLKVHYLNDHLIKMIHS